MGETDINELPLKEYRFSEANQCLEYMEKMDRLNLCNSLSNIYDKLFTYSSEVEICEMQNDFHYYYHNPTNTIFKESELGITDLEYKISNQSEIRIARISELSVSKGLISN